MLTETELKISFSYLPLHWELYELRKAVKNGKIDTGSKVEVDAEITIKNLNVSHKLNGKLTAPD